MAFRHRVQPDWDVLLTQEERDSLAKSNYSNMQRYYDLKRFVLTNKRLPKNIGEEKELFERVNHFLFKGWGTPENHKANSQLLLCLANLCW